MSEFVCLCSLARLPERPAGVEPAHPPWQGDRLPPTNASRRCPHGRFGVCRIVKDREHRVGVEPTSPRYEGGIFATRRPVLVSVGPVGIEPTSSGLRDRCITLSATVPCSRRGGSRTLDPDLIRVPLSPLSYAPASRAGGNRTHTCRIKSPVCCQLHHDPMLGRAYAFVASWQHRVFLSCRKLSVVALRIELSTTRLSAVSGQPALDYQRSSSREGGTRTHDLVFPKHAGWPLPYIPVLSQNGRI